MASTTPPGAVVSRRAVPLVVPAVVALAWAAAVMAAVTGQAGFLDHDALYQEGAPTWAALVLFLVAWQAMVAAMMLPSSLPMVRHFGQVAIRQGRPRSAVGAFVAGYVMVWTLFGAVAIAGDAVIHRLADAVAWVDRHPWVITGSVLLVAGAFQFSGLKDKCLTKCRAPASFLVQQFLRGVQGSFRLGVAHGWYCLGCCWPLMLLMFAAGIANLVWMAALTAVMVYEKVGREGRRLTPAIGIVLLVWGVLVLAHPAWLPRGLAGV
jgi:predicted metal-binding membrane protein